MKSKSLLIVLLALLTNICAFAYDAEIDGIYYNFFRSNATVTMGNYTGSVNIPSSVTYSGKTYSVTSIGSSAFNNCSSLTSITIPNSVTSIYGSAFYNCSGLTDVYCLAEYVPSTDGNAFLFSSYASATLHVPAGSVEAYSSTYPWNNFGTIVAIEPEIPDDAEIASGCLPANKWSGAAYTMKAITFDSGYGFGNWNESNPNYNQIVGVPAKDANGRNWYDLNYTCDWEERNAPLRDNWCQNFGDIYARRTFLWDGDMPDELYLACGHDDAPCEYYLNGELLFSETDGWFALEYRKLTEAQKALLRPGQLNVLAFHVHQNWGGMYADAGLYTNLYDMGIPDKCGDNLTWTFNAENGTLTVKGTGDMYDYSWSDSEWNPQQRAPWLGMKNAIKRVVVNNGATSIGAHAFDNCLNLTSVSLPGSVTIIRDAAFVNCQSLPSVTIPGSVTSIGFEAFRYCHALSNLTLNEGLTYIGWNAFEHCSLTSVTIPGSVTTLDNACFDGCNSLSEVTLNEGLINIGYHVFKACNLKNVVIPNTVESIGGYAFENLDNLNPSLESVVLGESLTEIGEGAFLNQGNLTKVTCLATVPPTISAVFTFANYDADLYVPSGCEAAYRNATIWQKFYNIHPIADNDIGIDDNADNNIKILLHSMITGQKI